MAVENNKYIELSALQNQIKNRIGFLESWVRVEIESHREVNGHHYLNVLEKTLDGVIAAKARARIWKSKASIIDDFTRITGKELVTGIAIVVKVTVEYHAQYGLALNIIDIDPSYSIGQRELEKKETIKKLTDAGLIDKQKGLELPYLPSSIAVISSQDAAGYGDFMKHIDSNPKKFKFRCTLFHSLMQGDNAPSMIIRKLNEIRHAGNFNVVLILRGGGAESDMFCFDDYELCKSIAEFPIPVLTAIGHERDYHVADMVAHSYFKTPTALADRLIDWTLNVETEMANALTSLQNALKERLIREESSISDILSNVKYYLSDRVNVMSTEIDSLFSSISGKLALRVENMTTSIDAYVNSIVSNTTQQIGRNNSKVSLMLNDIYHCVGKKIELNEGIIRESLLAIVNASYNKINIAENDVDRTVSTIQFAFNTTLNLWDTQIAMLNAGINSADPRGILRQGYVLAVDKDGSILKNVNAKNKGDDFSVRFSDGLWDCTINDIKINK